MQNSTRRLIMSFFSLIFLTGSVFVFASLIKPAFDGVIEKRAELLLKKKNFEDDKIYVEQVKKMISSYQESRDLKKNINSILPISESIPEALNQITYLASMNRLETTNLSSQVSAIEPRSTPLVRGLGVVNFNIQLSGSYESFRSFVENLETNIRIMNIKNLSIEPKGEGSKNNFNYNLAVDVYYQSN